MIYTAIISCDSVKWNLLSEGSLYTFNIVEFKTNHKLLQNYLTGRKNFYYRGVEEEYARELNSSKGFYEVTFEEDEYGVIKDTAVSVLPYTKSSFDDVTFDDENKTVENAAINSLCRPLAVSSELTENNYWTSVKQGNPKGWCNVMLCRYESVILDGKTVKKYSGIAFSTGLYNRFYSRWDIMCYNKEEFDVIAYHEINEDECDQFIKLMEE